MPKIKEKVLRDENGYSEKEKLRALNQRKVERPSKENLLKLIKVNSFLKLGRDFGVSDNTIRKWCKFYDLPFKQEDIKLLK